MTDIQGQGEFIVELKVFMGQIRQVITLHEKMIGEGQSDTRAIQELLNQQERRLFEIEVKLAQNSRATNSEIAYTPETVRRMLDALMAERDFNKSECASLRKEHRQVVWTCLASVLSSVIIGYFATFGHEKPKAKASGVLPSIPAIIRQNSIK